MQASDRDVFAETLADVFAYYARECSPFVVSLFWDALKRFDLDVVRRAFSLHAQDPDRGQFAPKIADITRLIEGSTATQGMRAWATVERAAKSVGAYQTVVFDDPLIHAVISDMGGWVRLCQTQQDELPFRAREFERNYAAYRTRREIPPFPARLAGICEAENTLNGYEAPRPILIGDPDRAMRVLTNGGASAPLQLTTAGEIAGQHLVRISRQDAA